MKLEALTPTKRQQLSLLDAGPRDSGDGGDTELARGPHHHLHPMGRASIEAMLAGSSGQTGELPVL